MSSVAVQLADALVAVLRAAAWDGVSYSVRRTYVDGSDEQMAAGLPDVDVAVLVPDSYEQVELETRGSIARQATVDVIIRRRFQPEDADDSTGEIQEHLLDESIELAEALFDESVAAGMLGQAGGMLQPPPSHEILYRRDHLRTLRQFTSVFSLTFDFSSDL